MVTREQFDEAVRKAYEILDEIIWEDQQDGTTTGLSYVALDVIENPPANHHAVRDLREAGYTGKPVILIHTYNERFPGNAHQVHVLGELDDGTIVAWLEDDIGIVTGKEAMDPIFDLFEWEG